MFRQIVESVYLVGGGGLSDGRDCLTYLVDLGELVLIDCGAGPGFRDIKENICAAGFEVERIHTLVLTHCHIDHIGSAQDVINESGCRVVAHQLDAAAIESGDPTKTAGEWYGLYPGGLQIDHEVEGVKETLEFSKGKLDLIHTPGHTPGSMVATYQSPEGHLVLFGQDIHGPFSDSFDSSIDDWERSMKNLISLKADILCEGHYGIYRGEKKVRKFIEDQLKNHLR